MENNFLQNLKAELIALTFSEEDIELSLKHANEKTLEGCMEWIN